MTAVDRIVTKDDASGPDPLQEPSGHLAHFLFAPVLDMSGPGDNTVAEQERVDPRWNRLVPVRRPEERDSIGSNCSRACAQLPPSFLSPDARERGVIPCMIADSMVSSGDLLDDFRMSCRHLADHEERPFGAVLRQKIEETGSIIRIRAIVKGKGNHLAGRPDSGDRAQQPSHEDVGKLMNKLYAGIFSIIRNGPFLEEAGVHFWGWGISKKVQGSC